LKKRWLLVGVLFLLISCLLAGCGVKQELHDAVVADLDAAQQELQSVEAELGETQTELETTEAELAAKRAELESSQSEVTSLLAEKDTLIADKEVLQADYDELADEKSAVEQELANIREVYPARHFSSRVELQDWLRENDVSDRPNTTFAEGWYEAALDIQEDALEDGLRDR
jgi:chromosome segregation ATPase